VLCAQQQLLSGDALQRLADTQAVDCVLQVEALGQHLKLHGAVAAQALCMLGAAQHDGLYGQVAWGCIVQLNNRDLVTAARDRTARCRKAQPHHGV
jgi:hypothetical protein